MSGQGSPALDELQHRVVALQEALAALAVAHAEGLNALAELARLLEDQYSGFRRKDDLLALSDAGRVNRRAARRSLEVAERLLAERRTAPDER